MNKKTLTAIGLMSGTSIDGIDVSLIKSDGHEIFKKELNYYYPYDLEIKKTLKQLINSQIKEDHDIKNAEILVTQKHINAVNDFIKINKLNKEEIDIIGFHGHTILHDPDNGITHQIGDAKMLALETQIDVVYDFRGKDVSLGGQGAPLVPIYHHALFKHHKKPVIILNIGGVSNITYLEDDKRENIIACDICFGNAPMDDLVHHFSGQEFDDGGRIASLGKINQELADIILKQDYFSKKPPKSLDRNHFSQLLNEKLLTNFSNIELKDALKTICYIIAKSLELEISKLNKKPVEIIVCGGGRNNKTIMQMLEEVCKIKVSNIDEYNLDGSAIESQAFAFLAIRHLKNLPITFRKTTGISINESCGGVLEIMLRHKLKKAMMQ